MRFNARAIGLFCLMAFLCLPSALFAAGEITGRMYDPGGNWGEMFVWAAKAGEGKMHGTFTENLTGRFEMGLETGTYTVGFSRKFSMGPIILPEVTVGDGKTSPVVLFYSDPYRAGGDGRIDGCKVYAQGFVSKGEHVRAARLNTVDVPKDIAMVFAVREETPQGKQIGPESADGNWDYGQVRLEKGKTYFLTASRKDGQPFSVANGAAIEGCPAYGDGKLITDGAIAGRVTADRIGITVSTFPPNGLLNGSACEKTMGQSFVANGTSLGMMDFIPAIGDGRRTQTIYTVRVLEGGPGGKQVGPTKQSAGSDIMAGFHLGFQRRTILYNRDELPLTPGGKYYIEITGDTGGFQVAVNDGSILGGEFYRDGKAVPGKSLDTALIEYTPDDCPPPPATNFTAQAAGTAVQLSFDIPENMDVNCAAVIRSAGGKPQELARFYVCPGQTAGYADRATKPNTKYEYSVVMVDCAGNKSEPATAAIDVKPLTSQTNLLVNGEFVSRGNTDGACPGWNTAKVSSGASWSVKEQDGMFSLRTWDRGHPYDVVAYQLVPVSKGKTYTFAAQTNRWDPFDNGWVNNVTLLGIDPLGGSDPLADSVVWSAPEFASDTWLAQSVKTTAQSDNITVYLRGRAMYGPWDPGMRMGFAKASLKMAATGGKK